MRSILTAVIVLAASIAFAEDNHDLHHMQYQNWWNNAGFNCCNNNDCGTLDPARVRESGGHTEVLVLDDRGDQWCPVEEKHLINQSRGKKFSPDWSVDHACIIPGASTVCDRMKCFMERFKG